MTVGELIRILELHPQDLRVMVDGYEGGVDDLEARFLLTRDVRLDVNAKWYYGRHEETYAGEKETEHETVPALVLRRPWHGIEE